MKLGRTVAELLDTIDATELVEWAAVYDCDPWTEDRADMRAALVCSTLARVNGAKVTTADFMPNFGPRETEPMTDDELRHQAIVFAAMFKGKVKRAD